VALSEYNAGNTTPKAPPEGAVRRRMSVDPAATRRLIESLSTHLEDHLATWKSSLVDARRDIEVLLTTLADKIPAHAEPLLPEDLVALMLEDAAPAPPAPAAAPASGAPQADWTVVRGSLAAIESARTQVDVLSRFLTRVNAHASRVALLVLRNDRLTGWKALGFDASGGRDESVRSLDLGSEDDPFIAAVLKSQHSVLAEPPSESGPLRRALGGQAPSRTLLVPMVIRDRLAGVVCADELPGEDGRLNEAAVEVLTFVTGLAVDLLAARKKIPSPSLTPTGEAIARFEPSLAPASPLPAVPDFEVEASLAPPSAAAPVPPPSQRSRSTDAGEALRAIEESAKSRIPPGIRSFSSDPGLTSQIPTMGAVPAPPAPSFPSFTPSPSFSAAPSFAAGPAVASAPTPPPAPAPTPAPPLSASLPGSLASPLSNASTGDFTGAFEALRASGRVGPPAEGEVTVQKPARASSSAVTPPRDIANAVRPISGFVPRGRATVADSPQRAHDDARRLARLLISEIKLYNEKKVEEGRVLNDLYERLKDDIERSRQVYDERTPAAVRQDTDFFHDELVRILADGRAEALGSVS
jgi:hypothetical protein